MRSVVPNRLLSCCMFRKPKVTSLYDITYRLWWYKAETLSPDSETRRVEAESERQAIQKLRSFETDSGIVTGVEIQDIKLVKKSDVLR